MAEQEVKFRKPSINFESILAKQRKLEDDEKFAISDSLQEFIDQSAKQGGYQNEEKLNKAGIRPDIITFVDNYTFSSLDGLKGADYDEALQTQKSTDKTLSELYKLKGDAKLSKAEREFLENTVGATNKKLDSVLGVSTRLKLAFRDFKKELKPLKLANRIGLTQIPIIGKRIERAIRAEEEGEAESLRMKKGLRKRSARETRKDNNSDVVANQTSSEAQQTKTQAKQATKQIMGQSTRTDLFKEDKEEKVEEERESDEQFDTSSGLLEKILVESELTNELLGKKSDKDGGLLGGIGGAEGILGYLGIKKFVKFIKGASLAKMAARLGLFGTAIAGLATPLALIATIVGIPAFLAYLNRAQGDEEKAELAEQGQNFSGSYMNEGVLQEDIDDENKRRLDAINKDEYKKLIARGDIDSELVSLEQYAKAKQDAGVGQRVTSYFSGKIKDDKVEKIMQIITSPTTNQGDMVTNTDTSSITNTTEKKMHTIESINKAHIAKATDSVAATTNNVVNNNVQTNDNSQNTNKTEYGSNTIGTKNNSGFVDYY